jgi:hypothetical protein
MSRISELLNPKKRKPEPPKKQDFVSRVKEEIKSAGNQKTFNWYQSKIKSVFGSTPTREDVEHLDKKRKTHSSSIIPGKMYFYGYDAKHKATLPYYDRFPLTIIIDITRDHFLGLNLHYLPYKYRIPILAKLEEFLVNPKNDEKAKLLFSYAMIRDVSKYPEVKPTIKRYLKSHVEGRFIEINPSEFIIAAMLPVASFTNNNQLKVWSDSLDKMGM